MSDRVICEECQRAGLRSTVTPLLCETTLMGWIPWYDEDGHRHEHDPNWNRRGFRCSNGHEWQVRWKAPCPTCGDSWWRECDA